MNKIEIDPIQAPFSDIYTRNRILKVKNKDLFTEDDIEYEAHLKWQSLGETERKDKAEKKEANLNNLGLILNDEGGIRKFTPKYYAMIESDADRMNAYRALTITDSEVTGEEAEIVENPFKFLFLPQNATLPQVRDAFIRLSKAHHPDVVMHADDEFKVPNQSADEVKKSQDEKMVRSLAKMQVINRAYAEAKKRFSTDEIASFGGFEWREEYVLSIHGEKVWKYEQLALEGEGQLRRRWGYTPGVFLVFDYGDIQLDDPDYRQALDLKAFFAWTELIQENGLTPTLLDDVSIKCKFDQSQSEQLRLMILNRETPDFIIEALNVTGNNPQFYLYSFLQSVYQGPLTTIETGYHAEASNETYYADMGVEITPESGLTLKYESQEFEGFLIGIEPQEVQFTPTDFKLMQSLAYGPLLVGPENIL